MKLDGVPFAAIDWAKVPASRHSGDSGEAIWRTSAAGELRVRMVEYTPGYVADHWCERGHVILVVAGEMDTELQDGRVVHLVAGMGYQVGDGQAPHRSRTTTGATLFIVD